MDIEKGLEEMGNYTLMQQSGGVGNLLSTDDTHKKKIKKNISKYLDPNYDPEDDDKYLENIAPWTPRELTIAGVASGSVLTSTLAIIMAGINPIIWATAIFGIVLPPYSAIQEQKLTDLKAMRETNGAMEREMENLEYNNERLKAENEKIEASVGRIQDMKDTLATCKKMGDKAMVQLEQQLASSKATLAQLEVNRTNELVDNIFDVMLAVDEDQNFSLSDAEIDVMVAKIKQIMNVEVDEEGLKNKIIENGRDLDSIMLLMKDILNVDTNSDGGGGVLLRPLD